MDGLSQQQEDNLRQRAQRQVMADQFQLQRQMQTETPRTDRNVSAPTERTASKKPKARRQRNHKDKKLPKRLRFHQRAEVQQTCSDCRATVKIERFELYRASRPRCPGCGGPLNFRNQA